MKVLIVDDSPEVMAIARARVASDGLDVTCAENAGDGLEAARREQPDLILLDVDMPDMSGFEVCKVLKEDPELCMIPVIFLTGSGRTEDKIRGLDLGAVDYITKPFDAFELLARVRAALRTKHLQDLLTRYARIDPLTELANRRALMDRLAQEWARMQRHGSSLSLIMADLDCFKRINDDFGHDVGDRMLREVAAVLKSNCRDCDLPGRYGGEEFVILAPDEDAESAAVLAERCRAGIEGIRFEANGGSARTTGSFGVADAPGPASAEDLIRSADKAMYQAKSAGRNRVELATCRREAPGLARAPRPVS